MTRDDVILTWRYGGIAYRDEQDRRYWNCSNSDYAWKTVTDDFGNLIAVSHYTNLRGY